MSVGHVPVGGYGTTWWWQNGHLQTTTEPLQPHQHDLPTRKFSSYCTIKCVYMFYKQDLLFSVCVLMIKFKELKIRCNISSILL